jgi:formate-nitrite transporter family protein
MCGIPVRPSLMSDPEASADSVQPDVAPRDEDDTFDRIVDEGQQRLGRSWVQLIATGFLGGFDVSVGVLALLLVEELTHNPLLSGLAFSAGFIALTLARSELFTENFLVPVVAVVAKAGNAKGLARLWGTTLLTNLVAGWLLSALLMVAFPSLRETAVQVAGKYIALGITWQAFALAVVGGMLITVMTHLQHSTESDGVRLIPAVIVGVMLSIGHVNHAVVASLSCFAALVAGAPFGYGDWAGMLVLAIVGNMVGGLGLVTLLRLLQLPHKVIEARDDE